jgi:hypothetical protein
MAYGGYGRRVGGRFRRRGIVTRRRYAWLPTLLGFLAVVGIGVVIYLLLR